LETAAVVEGVRNCLKELIESSFSVRLKFNSDHLIYIFYYMTKVAVYASDYDLSQTRSFGEEKIIEIMLRREEQTEKPCGLASNGIENVGASLKADFLARTNRKKKEDHSFQYLQRQSSQR